MQKIGLNKEDNTVRDIFSIVAPYIDPLDTAFSLGLCHLWRKRLVSGVKAGDKALDLCSGTGEVAKLLIGKVGPEGSVTCLDFSEEMTSVAKSKLSPIPQNVSFIISDVRKMSFPDGSFDVATISFGIRNVPDTGDALKEIKRVLRPGGRFFCLELTRPEKKYLLPLYDFYTFKFMPAVAKIVTKDPLPYTYLPKSIRAFYPPAEFKRLMSECGFLNVRSRSLSQGVATIFTAEKGK